MELVRNGLAISISNQNNLKTTMKGKDNPQNSWSFELQQNKKNIHEFIYIYIYIYMDSLTLRVKLDLR